MGIPNPILYFPSNHFWTTDVQYPYLWTDFYIFSSLTWKFDRNSKSDIVLHLKWFTGPQRFMIMIRCKIDFDIIWYTVIFAANLILYLSLFVWSSDILNFVFMNVVILVSVLFTLYTNTSTNLRIVYMWINILKGW